MKSITKIIFMIVFIVFYGCKETNTSVSKETNTTGNITIANEICNPNKDLVEKLNKDRNNIDIINLSTNKDLSCSAKHHVLYLNNSGDIAHVEHNQSNPYYYAKTPSDRAIKSGFNTTFVFETFTYGVPDWKRSLYFLYNAIYHRLSIFNQDIDVLGQYNKKEANVIEFSNNELNNFCDPNYDDNFDNGLVVEGVCAKKKYLPYNEFKQSLEDVEKQNNPIIIYPNNETYAYPVYQQETPDPLNGVYVAGTPISIVLNHYYNKNYTKSYIKSFELIDLNTNKNIDTYEINSTNDTNKMFEPGEFAFYPKEQLKWNNNYKVITTVYNGDNFQNLEWIFHTLSANAPIINVPYNNGKEQDIEINNNKLYLLYIVPSDSKDVFEGLSYSGEYNMNISIENYSYIYIKAVDGKQSQKVELDILSKDQKIRKLNLIIK